jgi:hypothetical protein
VTPAADAGADGRIDVPTPAMTAGEHDLQRALVAASLLIVGENPRPLLELAVDPGTYTPSDVVGRHAGMFNPGALLQRDRTSHRRSPG